LVKGVTIESIHASWQRIKKLNHSIFSLAEQGHWKSVVDTVIDRRKQLNHHFSLYPVGPATAEFYREKMNSIYSIENHVEAIAREARARAFRQ
jgi:hypothetical protein